MKNILLAAITIIVLATSANAAPVPQKRQDCEGNMLPFLQSYFDELNYCETTADCQIVPLSGYSCTGGFINKTHYNERQKLEELYEKQCNWGCDKSYTPSHVYCVKSKCISMPENKLTKSKK